MDCKQHVNGDFKFLSHELRCLIWHRFPLKSMPSNFHPEYPVDLDMCFSHLEQLWEGTEPLRKLQFINLSHSPYLRKTSDMTEVPRLKKLILEGCTSLFEVHPSISYPLLVISWSDQSIYQDSEKGGMLYKHGKLDNEK